MTLCGFHQQERRLLQWSKLNSAELWTQEVAVVEERGGPGGCYGNKIEVVDVAVKGEVFWKRGRMDGREQGREEGLCLQEMYLAISWSYN